MTKLAEISYLSIFVVPVFILFGYFSGHPLFFATLILLFFPLAELLDHLLPRDVSTPLEIIDMQDNAGPFKFDFKNLILFAFIILQIMLIMIGLYFVVYQKPTVLWLSYAILVGLSGGLALNIAHELMHKSNRFETVMATIAGVFQFWSINEYEHLYVHHRNEFACTEEDVGCARRGQSIYSYLIKIILAVIRHAFTIENENLHRANKSFWSFSNRVLLQLFTSLLITIAIGFIFGWLGVIFFFIQCLTSLSLFYLFPYNQHYGLLRRRKSNGEYEEFTFLNTWSSDRYLTNRLFFNLPRHSHHHLYQFCRYYELKTIKNSPILPLGYMGTLAVCLIPPLWFKLMDKRVLAVYQLRDQLEKEGILS